MKLGLISDVHASPQVLKSALQWLEASQVDKILCAGDIAGYYDRLEETIDLLTSYHCDCICGNHDAAWLTEHADQAGKPVYEFLAALPVTRQYQFDNKTLYMVHAEPPDRMHGGIKLLDENGALVYQRLTEWRQRLADFDFDILLVGHTHQVFCQRIGHTLVVNPGSVPFNHSAMILDCATGAARIHAVGDHPLVPSWNWSMLTQRK